MLEYDSWGSRIRKEISELPSEFEIVPHVVEMMKCLAKINLVIIQEDLPELIRSAEFIEQLIDPAKGKEGIPCILKLLEIKRETDKTIKEMQVEITNIPFHIVQFVLNIRRQTQPQ